MSDSSNSVTERTCDLRYRELRSQSRLKSVARATGSTYRVEFLSFWQAYFLLCAFRPMFMRPRPHSENNSNFRLRPATRAWHIPLPPLRPNPGKSACPDGKPKSIQSVSRRLCASAVSSRFLRVSASKSGPVWFRLCRVRERLVRLFRDDPLPLNSRRTAFCECPHLLYRRHGGVAWKRGEQRAVRPTQINRFLRRFARKKTIEETGSKAVAPADAVQDIQFAHRRHAVLAADPGHRAPTVAAGGMHVAQRGRDHLDLRVTLHHAANHSEKCARIELGFRSDLRAGDAQPFLQVFLVANEHVHVLDDAPQHLAHAFRPARALPELLAAVEIE